MLAEMAIASLAIIGGLPSQLLMTIGRSLRRIAIFGTICVGASILPELTLPVAFLSTDKGQEFLTKVAEMISGVTMGNTANAIDNFPTGRADYVRLENEDLIRVSGKAIAQIIFLASQNRKYDRSTRNHLKNIAAKATENWVILARSEFFQSTYHELTEREIPLIITPSEARLTQSEILTFEEWRTIFLKLDLMTVDPGKGVELATHVRQDVSELLQKEFPRVLREALKQDFKEDGKAFAGLMIQLITGIRQQLGQQGIVTLNLLEKLSYLEQQLTGTEQQIERLFIAISTQMQTGFDELCLQFGIVEKSINRNLQQLQYVLINKLDEQSHKLDFILDLIQPRPCENIENKLLNALLHLNYDKQVNLFKEFVENHQIGACLIHGPLESGPRWLLNRLIRNVPNGNTSNFVKKIKFSRRTQNSSLESIFQEISRKVEINKTSSLTAIHKKICELWQSQTVILILENTHEVEESYLETFLQEFWQPLADLASQMGTADENHSLLLFLLDEDGFTNDWQIPYTQDPTSELIPQTLIKFMEIQPIKRRQLSTWLELYLCADNLLQYTDSLVDEVLRDNEKGTHQYILEKICCLCQITWEDCESKWLKY
ncbi:hypothetical protein [Laspinema olomoucense]|uniref:Inactive STAND domain-containing protein n=1 Tax=Laspinema olomoucense D3b TaxID=2953688 RepID=A0ABT2NAC3_9CYAN|nr:MULTISPECIES: hypothetical protein [unclassified Laspinema]MCT7978794.1 hypothetical protein [Laspinema sp. D3b]MCT7997084.1 hypothetical protein [Laspinema sp. D3c]